MKQKKQRRLEINEYEKERTEERTYQRRRGVIKIKLKERMVA